MQSQKGLRVPLKTAPQPEKAPAPGGNGAPRAAAPPARATLPPQRKA
jgi:hypothetical protein